MLQTNTADYESRLRPKPSVATPSVDLPAGERAAARHQQQREVAIDDALAASFPASDPPAWNAGLARPRPVSTLRSRADDGQPAAARGEPPNHGPEVDVSCPYSSKRTLLQMLISLAGAASIALLVPFAILLVGLPIALGVRGLLEVLLWFFH